MSYYDDFSELSFSEKEAYTGGRFGYMYCGYNMEQIDTDESLSDRQKQEIKDHLFYYGD